MTLHANHGHLDVAAPGQLYRIAKRTRTCCQNALASGSYPAPEGLGEKRDMTAPARPSKRCRTLLSELSRYLDGDLTSARRRTVERHIKACACCGTMAARLRRTMAVCRAGGKRRPPKDVMSRAAERIRALIARKRRRRSTSGSARR
jgi:hypothetical protein